MTEISPSELSALAEKVNKGKYGKYLRRVILRKVRGFTDKEVRFDFPVTALIGPNGGGKSTILGAAALAYRGVKPERFFAKSGRYDSSMVKWSIEHGVIDKEVDPAAEVRRSVNFPSSKWNRKPFVRDVLVFGVTRTVPATERADLRLARGSSFKAISETNLPSKVIEATQAILGKTVDGYSELDVTTRATLYAAKDDGTGTSYTEFHFGAGQASIIRIVAGIEAAEENSLILIEEIENGLHPVATRRLVDYLISVAIRKKCQVIFTTHSSEALEALPSDAVWAAIDGEVMQGTLNIAALRSITGAIPAQVVVFVEDGFGELVLAAALRHHGADLSAVAIHGLGGAEQAIKIQEGRLKDPTAVVPSVVFLDGDKADKENDANRIYVLPGGDDPEVHVYDVVLGDLDNQAAKLTAALNLPMDQQNRVKEVVRETGLTNHDRHIIFRQIGEKLDLTAELVVANAFLGLWAQLRPDEITALLSPIQERLPMKAP
ncbi:AAA family ATPase [Mycolicibacterium sp. 141076]|uniref:ATP-dependent nuclease n=1 Tax=Mycobacteriaceae TaxID=1762 RepID=UPI00299E055E|nr:AAA family ATPase [Mycolicibacterium sp. 141076]MDX1881642.1 AAA family ATPase [Mycolicibacterium sp. 141076]